MTSKNKRKNQDRLSNLPEEILTNVLSLLPINLAVRTSILSKRWRYSWMMVSNLDLDNVTPYEYISQVLELRKSKVEILKLHFSKLKVSKPTVSKWISEAVRLNVSELDILVKQVDLPLSLFTCKTLTTFRLKFHFQSEALWACPSLVSLPCLKTLDIVVYSNPLESAFKLIHGCPILENLSLEITMPGSGENYYFEIPTLKRLTFIIAGSLKTNHKVELNLPNLEYLSIRQNFRLDSLFGIKDLSSLVEAKTSCGIDTDGYSWFKFLKGIRSAKCLSIDIGNYSFPLIKQSSSSLPKFTNVKQLELRGYFSRNWFLVPKFLERCSQLEHFSIDEPYGDFESEEPESVPSCMLANLKTIKVTNFRGNKSILQFLKFMLAKSEVLKMLITVTFCKKVPLLEEGSLCQDISMLPRASKDCEFHFVWKRPHATTPLYF
ncbi:FBD-like protein [Tanacetum coccineum]